MYTHFTEVVVTVSEHMYVRMTRNYSAIFHAARLIFVRNRNRDPLVYSGYTQDTSTDIYLYFIFRCTLRMLHSPAWIHH